MGRGKGYLNEIRGKGRDKGTRIERGKGVLESLMRKGEIKGYVWRGGKGKEDEER